VTTIDYPFSFQVDSIGRFHLLFDCILAAGRLTPKLQALMPMENPQMLLFYSHKGGTANNICLEGPPGAGAFNEFISPWVWPAKAGSKKAFFRITIGGELVKPEACSKCGKKNPSIRETLVEEGRAVQENLYCENCSADFADMLIKAGHDG
jgi:hypothetical protein